MTDSPGAGTRQPLRLLCVLAHPDDESLGTGGTLARYAAEGVETFLITATSGQRGWKGAREDYPGPETLGRLRAAELQAAAQVLGIRHTEMLGYMDAELDQVDPAEAVSRIARLIRRFRPQVVVTFGPDGAYGHPDHIAISQFTVAALVQAAFDGGTEPEDNRPHRASKLYFLAGTRELLAVYQSVIGEIRKVVDSVERKAVAWEDWAVTTRIDAADHWRTVQEAVSCHRSQLRDYQGIQRLPEEMHRKIWGNQTFYRVFSLVNGGRTLEKDLFEGLR